MLVDLLIIVCGLAALYRGKDSGFVRQFCAAVGFFGGLFIGSWLQRHTINFGHTPEDRAAILVSTTLACALIGLTLGEYLGADLKRRIFGKHVNKLDNASGSLLNLAALLVSVWLLASVVTSLPFGNLKMTLRSSHIMGGLNRLLPPAPSVIAQFGRIIDPNGFPDVFIGNEPIPRGKVNLPALGELETAVNADKDSVVRIEGQGCGGVVTGSGFVVGKDLVATNAHVVAGIRRPFAQDANGTHRANVIWFDPALDFAVLRVSNLAGHNLAIEPEIAGSGTPAAVLGYPGGADFKAGPAAVMDEFRARGHDIYGKGHTLRKVYEVRADIIPGNSGGPLVTTNGNVIGVVFAESTTYNHVGYALTAGQITDELSQATHSNRTVSTGSCAEAE